jgi:5'-3' exonuclease
MGIPSYFSYLIHNHRGVLCKHANMKNIVFERLYMDCNSILYDCFRKIKSTSETFTEELLELTAIEIEKYICLINPTQYVYIAFDGVAPMAKMDQQRTRRYKSWFDSCVMEKITPTSSASNTTTSIFTPGTEFMNKLTIFIRNRFRDRNIKIIVATPDEPGEGEHKLFAHLRAVPCLPNETCAIYGLDADLIMLSLFHLTYCRNLYIFREAPQFGSLSADETENVPLFLDMNKFGHSIAGEMRCSATDNHRMCDYMFMCFMLGNDFLPHFPGLNIRTVGIKSLLDAYRVKIGCSPERFLVSRKMKIQWKEVSALIHELAKHEDGFILDEYAKRRKWDQTPVDLLPKQSVKEKTELFHNTPVLYRKEEKLIRPEEPGWEARYYKILFPANTKTQDICVNYLEGLEWVFQYYTAGKVDWVWKYKYHYPPLLKDLAPIVPINTTTFLPIRETKPVKAHTQLAYVLPPVHHHLLNPTLAKKLRTQYKQYYIGCPNEDGIPQLKFQWAFCRYFWECHVDLPVIPSDMMDDIDHSSI